MRKIPHSIGSKDIHAVAIFNSRNAYMVNSAPHNSNIIYIMYPEGYVDKSNSHYPSDSKVIDRQAQAFWQSKKSAEVI